MSVETNSHNYTNMNLILSQIFVARPNFAQVILYGLPPVASFQNKLRLAAVFFALHINVFLDDRFVDTHG